MGSPPQNRTQRLTRRNAGDTGTVGGLLFLHYFDTPLHIFGETGNSPINPQLTSLNSLPL